MKEIDYTKYTLEELLECQESIDAESYPERAAQIKLLIKDRAKSHSVQRVSMADDNGDIAAIKTGRAPSLGRGIAEIVGGTLFGVIWLNAVSKTGSPEYFPLIGYFVIISSIVGGAYHIYNALAKNRFTAQDIVSPDKEPDPLEQLLNLNERTQPNRANFCGHCGNELNGSFKFCPNCGTRA
ncbi:MAG: zinc-ribbon domain-containing protein [Alteromonadaceae bacterium]|nr:zinc-ribbon domain-containing protein [Alteromonadaceae bacterium]